LGGLAVEVPEAPGPPQPNRPVGSAAYHLAAMLKYTKRLYDEIGVLEDSRFD